MAIVGDATAIGEGRPGEEMESGRKRFTRTYVVRTDDPANGPNVVLTAPGLPPMGSAYSGHPTAVVTGRFPHPLSGTRKVWHVEVEWDTHSVDRDEDPLKTRPQIEWGAEVFDEPLLGTAKSDGYPMQYQARDDASVNPVPVTAENFFFGRGVVNTAGDPFDPPKTRPNYYPAVRFTRNESKFNPAYAMFYGNTVNRLPWNTLDKRQVLLKVIEASHQVQLSDGLDKPDILYWRVSYVFVLKFTTWDMFILNSGHRYLTLPNTNQAALKVPFLRDGHPYEGLLKPDGTRYTPGQEQKPSWIPVPCYRAVDFAPLFINLNLNINDLRKMKG